MNLTSLSLLETQQLLADKKASAAEVTQAYLDRIKAVDPKVESYLFVNDNAASEAANVSGGALAGIPIAHKDVVNTRGMPTTAASKMLDGYISPYDATVTEKLSAAGAVTLGKVNTDEFTMGSSTETSAYKKTKNPWDLARIPGGSSGGSAAAVAADLCVFATGTDTGGSIRQPASLCGITGLKVTYGRVSRYGVMPMASSLDTIGVLTKTVADAAAALRIIAGRDPRDATTGHVDVPDYAAALTGDIRGLRVGVPREYFIGGLDADVESTVRAAIEKLRELGATIVDISLPHTRYALPVYYIVCPSEVSANMARLDGIRYGPTVSDAEDLVDMYFKNRTAGFGDEVKRRIMLGTFALSAGYADAYYKKALAVRTLIIRDFEAAFRECDVIATPVNPSTAFRFGEKTDDPVQMYLEDVFTIPASLAGVPAISVPAGFDSKNLPIGLQLIGAQWAEPTILRAAHAYQMATDWHTRKPTL